MIVAPATATTIAKMANGICDNILTATYLSARCPVFIAPAMDLDMWKHQATLRNLKLLQSDGVGLIPVGNGELASGLVGEGRMAEPEEIVQHLTQFFNQKNDFFNKKILITAGPTYEAIDPVRFVGNRSSGKMGVAIAEEIANRGGQVELVLGPSSLKINHDNINVTRVESAQQMYEACVKYYGECQIGILSAAVADYRPSVVADQKIKKKDATLTIELEKTTDIAASLGKIKQENQLLIGFALETNDELANAQSKLERKNFDFIVLNSLRDSGAGFAGDTNKITIVHRHNKIVNFELKSKSDVAKDIVDEIFKIS